MTGGMEFWLAVHSSNPRLATSALGQKRTFSQSDVRFTPKSRRRLERSASPLWANSGLIASQQNSALSISSKIFLLRTAGSYTWGMITDVAAI